MSGNDQRFAALNVIEQLRQAGFRLGRLNLTIKILSSRFD
jgi:hypothetical protein